MTRPLVTRIKEVHSTANVPSGFIILVAGVVAVLFGIQFLISNQIIPWDVATRYLFLNIQSPTLSSVFLCHYVHSPFSPEHLCIVVLLFVLTMCCIYVCRYFVLPALGWMPPAHLMRNTFLCIFLLLPFLLSGIAILIGDKTSTFYLSGSSGIVAAVMGFAVFLVATALVRICRERREEGRGCVGPYALGIVAVLLPLAFWIVLAGWDVLPVAIHFGGYFFGLAVPLLLSWASGTVKG